MRESSISYVASLEHSLWCRRRGRMTKLWWCKERTHQDCQWQHTTAKWESCSWTLQYSWVILQNRLSRWLGKVKTSFHIIPEGLTNKLATLITSGPITKRTVLFWFDHQKEWPQKKQFLTLLPQAIIYWSYDRWLTDFHRQMTGTRLC